MNTQPYFSNNNNNNNNNHNDQNNQTCCCRSNNNNNNNNNNSQLFCTRTEEERPHQKFGQSPANKQQKFCRDDFESLHRCKRATRWTIRIFLFVVVTALCTYQTYQVCELYFRYPTTVNIQLDQSSSVHLPSVTICSELASTVKRDQLDRLAPELVRRYNHNNNNLAGAGANRTRNHTTAYSIRELMTRTRFRHSLLQRLHSLSIDQLHRATVNADELFRECHLPVVSSATVMNSNRTTVINCSQFAPIVETVSRSHKCFSLFSNRSTSFSHRLPDPATFDIPKHVIDQFKYFIWADLRLQYIHNGFVYIHPPAISHQYANSKNVQPIHPGRHQLATLAFDRETIQLLPPPYETDCQDYRRPSLTTTTTTGPYQCRADCVTACKVRRYRALDGWPGDVFAEPDVRSNWSRVWTNVDSAAGHLQEGMSGESLSVCSDHCGHRDDCERIQYDVRTVLTVQRDFEDPETASVFGLRILPPEDVQLVVKHEAKFAPIEFLIYVGGLISFYLGYSVISFGTGLFTYLSFSTKLQTKYCCVPIQKDRLAAKSGRDPADFEADPVDRRNNNHAGNNGNAIKMKPRKHTSRGTAHHNSRPVELY